MTAYLVGAIDIHDEEGYGNIVQAWDRFSANFPDWKFFRWTTTPWSLKGNAPHTINLS